MMESRKEFLICNYKVSDCNPPFIIAEAGVNHNGSLDIALKLIDAAAEAGADAVKFQTFRADQVVTHAGNMADYQKRNLGKESSQIEMLRELELKEDWYPILIKRANDKGIIFISTPHGGKDSVDLLESHNIPAFKFGSGDLTNIPLLVYAAKLNKPMLISTGMSSLEETREAVEAIKKTGNHQILVFQCTTDYPLSPEFVNLRVIQTLRHELDVLVGFSDHTTGHHASSLAVALGACMIERHLTLDCNMKGPDHIASTEPKEFQAMVATLKLISKDLAMTAKELNLVAEEVETLLGSSEKKPQTPELQYMTVARKSIVSSRPIKAGEKLSNANLTIKRPGNGLPPKYLTQILGQFARIDIPPDVLLEMEMFAHDTAVAD